MISVSTDNNKIVRALIHAPIFPILVKDTTSTFDYLGTVQQTEVWFVADRWHLRQCFEGLVPLLAMSVETIEKIHHLIRKVNLRHKLLSNAAHDIPRIRGLSMPCPEYTLSLRAKARFIARYVSFGRILDRYVYHLSRKKHQTFVCLKLLI